MRALIVLLTNAVELHGYAARAMYAALAQDIEGAELSLVIACAWFLGVLPVMSCARLAPEAQHLSRLQRRVPCSTAALTGRF